MLRYLLILLIFCPIGISALTLEQKIQRELELLNLPSAPWRTIDQEVCDVAIIGAGQAGVAIAHALELEGIFNTVVFDCKEEGKEGPWLTTARMRTLRSGKHLAGPAMLPHLTFRAWYEANHGKEAWEKMDKIPTTLWGEYLKWMRKTVGVTVCNGWKLEKILPCPDLSLRLIFEGNREVLCRKVVLATGRSGFGGAEIPDFIKSLPKKYWAHTSEVIDPAIFKRKKVAVVGVGASGFDAAAQALENGASAVQMIMRRTSLPHVNYAAPFAYRGFMHGFYYLSDKERTDYFTKVFEAGIPPPAESLTRLDPFPTFELLASTHIQEVSLVDRRLHIHTNQGTLKTDFMILATGYAVDGSQVTELDEFYENILLWQDRCPNLSAKLGRFAYLGPHFEFLEKVPGQTPYIANVHCFNYGGFLSHGRICGDIDCLDVGIRRLVEGIAVDLFLQDTCRNGGPTPHDCPGTCQSGLCSPFAPQEAYAE